VNPKKPNLAVNLGQTKTIALKQNMLFLDDHTWVFDNDDEAKEVYEGMIKAVQEYRYRK
jgi:hypothetical protein